MSAPTSYEELRSALQQRMDSLAPGQQRIATLLLTDPDGTAFRTISETAGLADVHQSSLVRFAGAFGLKGYPALVALCRQHLAQEADLVTRFARAQQRSGTGEYLSATVEHEQQNLRRTFTRIAPDQWDRTVRLLADADRVHVMGLRKCLPVAQLMSYLLRLVRPGVHQIAPITGALVDDLRDLRPQDVFVAVSIHRYTAETVRAFTEAKRSGLHTVAFTDTAASPLARVADVTFLVDCEGVAILRSVAAFISLVQALATAVALHNGTQSRDELLSDERLLSEFSVYSR
ncbi:MAG: MurR/RpiR family transcriptional regulator [Sciscionella sp.]